MEKQSDVFGKIYREELWGKDGGGSGRGSTLENAENTAIAIKNVLKKYNLHRLLDAPCGALEWTLPFIQTMHDADPAFEYCGVDVVQSVVDANAEKLTESWCECVARDLAIDELPKGYDLILCRDAIQHNSYSQIAGIMKGFAESGTTYLLVTSFSRLAKNSFLWSEQNFDIETGHFFHNNFRRSPFKFKEGLLEVIDDHRPTGATKGHKLFLYDMQKLAASDAFRQYLEKYLPTA